MVAKWLIDYFDVISDHDLEMTLYGSAFVDRVYPGFYFVAVDLDSRDDVVEDPFPEEIMALCVEVAEDWEGWL